MVMVVRVVVILNIAVVDVVDSRQSNRASGGEEESESCEAGGELHCDEWFSVCGDGL